MPRWFPEMSGSQAPSHGKPIAAYDRTSRGAEAYTALAAEFLKRQTP